MRLTNSKKEMNMKKAILMIVNSFVILHCFNHKKQKKTTLYYPYTLLIKHKGEIS
ncbi:spore coat protein B [Bacillus pseudomycoides]|nr:spore coat protein B [Bacillus pseudomycoides]